MLMVKVSSISSRSYPFRRSLSLVGILIILLVTIVGTRLGKGSKGTTSYQHKIFSSINMEKIKYIEIPSGREDVKRYSTEQPISIHDWMSLVSTSSPLGVQAAVDLSDIIAYSPYASVLFEIPGTTLQSSSSDQFEFAIINQPALQRFAESMPDKMAFDEHFNTCKKNEKDKTVCSFANLGGDAKLVSPLPQSNIDDKSYAHLAIFIRNAHRNRDQVTEFWKLAASTYINVLKQKNEVDKDAKTWFSTNGMGVSWLHLRIDNRPKYYSYNPFK